LPIPKRVAETVLVGAEDIGKTAELHLLLKSAGEDVEGAVRVGQRLVADAKKQDRRTTR
jgi:ATPase subunit of ABC transporter with duplicated ATPase domains